MNQTLTTSAAIAGMIFLSSSAMAQEAAVAVEAEAAPAEASAEVAADAEAAPEEETAEVEEAPEAVEEAPEEEAVVEEEAEVAEEAPAEEVAEEAPAKEEAEAEGEGGASIFAFADAWAGWQSAKSGGPGGGGVYANAGPGGTAESGFGLNWLGTDLGYDGGEWGLTGSLRYGDGVAVYGTGTLGPVTQAYATWKPAEGLALDLGTFGTIYGAEVAESWANLNYTRGELYFNMQPFWHTGLRAEYVTGNLTFRGLVVNDANTSNLGGGAVNLGAQASYGTDMFSLTAGILQSMLPETTAANGGFVDTFVDVVATVNAGDFSLVGNFDLNAGYETAAFWGASLAAGYQFVPAFGMAVRGEYLSAKDDFLGFGSVDGEDDLVTGTLTFDVKPAGVDNFVVRWDNRIEAATEEVYLNGDGTDTTKTWMSSTVGVVGFADFL